MAEGAALLLGCGSVGVATARRLGQDLAFRRVISVDRDAQRAAAAAEACGGKAESAKFEISEDCPLDRILEDVDLVVNTIQMSLSEALPLMRSVLEAGVSYVDACSDPEALQAVFDSQYLDALAGYRAVSAVPGLGASPGLTNALTSYLGQRLEQVDEASFYLADDLGCRSLRQWRNRLFDFGATALVWRDNDWRHVAPFSEFKEISFPGPQGTVFCSTVGLGPVTLPASIATLGNVSSHRGFRDAAVLEIVRNLIDYGFGSEDLVETTAGSVSPLGFASALFSLPRDIWSGGGAATSLFGNYAPQGPRVRQAQVAGMLRGRKIRFIMTYYFPGEEDADNIASTLAVGARMLLTREIQAPGVHPPEYLDPAPFLWDMERRGVEIQLSKTFEDRLAPG